VLLPLLALATTVVALVIEEVFKVLLADFVVLTAY